MGKFNTRNGLSSLANSDVLGQLSINGGGASIPLLVDGATNRLLTLSDTNSAADAVLAVQDSDGDLLFEVRPSGIRIGGNYQLPLADSAFANYFLKSNAAGTVSWANPFSSLTLSDITDLELSPLSTGAVNGAYLRYDSANSQWVADGPHAGFHANRQLGTITKGTPVRRTGSGQGGGIYEMGVGSTNNDYRCVGIAFDAQDASSRLIVMTDGLIGGLDTSSYSTDDILYVSNTTGELTATAPTSGLYQQRVARVVASDATNGVIQVTVDPNFDEAEYLENLTAESLGSLSDVTITSAANGEVLQYNGTEWENASLDTIVVVDVHNNSGADITKGTPVYVSGEHASGKPTIALADNNGTGTYPAIGLVQADITDGTDGNVVLSGPLLNLNTSSYTAGDALYIDSTAGALTSTRPTSATEAVQKVALVTKSHASSGSVVVMGAGRVNDIPNDVVLDDLDGVDLTTTAPTTNDVLQYDGTNWVPAAGGSQTLDEVLTAGSASTQDAQFGGVTVSQSDSGSSFISINSLADGSDWAALSITSTSASPADDDYIGKISWNGQNDAAQNTNYGSIGMQTINVADGDEDGAINFNVRADGAVAEVLELRGNAITARKSTTVIGSLETQTTSTLKGFEAISSDGTGSDWNAFAMTRYTVSPADNDIIGSFKFNQLNDASEAIGFAAIQGIATDVTDGTEDGALAISTVVNGATTEGLRVTGGTIKVADAFTLPTADGSANQVLQTNGSGTVSWASAPAPSSIADIGDVLVSSPSGNQVLKWDPVDLRWENGAVPVPTLAEVTATGASTTTTVTFASILQTGSTLNVAASGNHYGQLRATTLEVGTSATEQYEFPASDGNDGEVLMTDGSGALSFAKTRSMTFSNSGVHQLTTSTDTFYRLCAATTAPNSTYWTRTTSSTAPTSLTRSAQYAKAGHVIPVDITNAVVNCTVSSSISASASSDSSASEYPGDTITYYLYKWPDGAVATQVASWTDTFNGGVSYAEEQSSPAEFTLTANAGDALFVVARCFESATATRYWSMQYTIDIQY